MCLFRVSKRHIYAVSNYFTDNGALSFTKVSIECDEQFPFK